MKVPYILALEGHFPGSTSSHFLGFLVFQASMLGCISFYFTNFWDVFHSISIFGMYFILFLFLGCISSLTTVDFFLVLRFSSRAKNLVPVINDNLWSGRLSWISTEGSNQDGWTHVQIPHAHVAFQSLAVGDGWWWWIPPWGCPPLPQNMRTRLSVGSLLVPFNQDLEQWFSGI